MNRENLKIYIILFRTLFARFKFRIVILTALGFVNGILDAAGIGLLIPLFSLVVNAIIFWFLSTIVKGLQVDGFVAAFLGALFVSAVMFITDKILRNEE